MAIRFATTLHHYQKVAVAKAKAYYNDFSLDAPKIFRFNICTGGGKTVCAIRLAVKMVGQGTIVVVCHTNNLAAQFEREVCAEMGLIQKPSNWFFYTYQSLRNKTLKDHPRIDFMIVDESHQGGLTDEGSYAKILKKFKPKHVLALSATDYGLSEGVFGVKGDNNTFVFRYEDAMEAGVLNDCEILTIHTGLNQVLAGELDEKTVEEEDLSDLLATDKEEGVDLANAKSRLAIEEANLLAAIEVYFARECDLRAKKFNQAAFFVRTIAQAEKALEFFGKRLSFHATKAKVKGLSMGAGFCRVSHSKMTSDNINDFKAKKFPVLINVKQVQEGFNDPDLALIFDCSPSFTNDGRVFFQRLGRSVRKKDGKPTSRYYTFYRVSGSVSKYDSTEAAKEAIGAAEYEAMKPEQKEAIEGNVNVAATLQGFLRSETDEKNLMVGVDAFAAPDAVATNKVFGESAILAAILDKQPAKIYVAKSSYTVKKATGHKQKDCVRLFDILRAAKDAHFMQELLDSNSTDVAEWIRLLDAMPEPEVKV